MGVVVSSSHFGSAAPSSSGGGLLTRFHRSNVRSLSRETVLHKLLQRESFPQAAALHDLPQRGSLPRGAVLQEQAAPAWVPSHRVTSPASKPAPAWAPLSTGPQVLPGACCSVGSPRGHSFLQAFPCSGVGSLPRATGGDLLHHGPPGTAGVQPASLCLHRKALCSGVWSTSSSCFTDLGVCRVVSLTSSLPSLYTAVSPQFFSSPS